MHCHSIPSGSACRSSSCFSVHPFAFEGFSTEFGGHIPQFARISGVCYLPPEACRPCRLSHQMIYDRLAACLVPSVIAGYSPQGVAWELPRQLPSDAGLPTPHHPKRRPLHGRLLLGREFRGQNTKLTRQPLANRVVRPRNTTNVIRLISVY